MDIEVLVSTENDKDFENNMVSISALRSGWPSRSIAPRLFVIWFADRQLTGRGPGDRPFFL
uniref:Uncharacterized protein n=1 Tax=Pseudomonas phage PACT201 TaxID=3230130 RepID=A0AAU8GV07_9VIRU